MSPSDKPLEIDITEKGDFVVVRLSGSAGMEMCSLLNERLLDASESKPKGLVIDLADLDFICSLGLGSIVAAYLRTAKQGGTFRLVSPQPQVGELLKITKLQTLWSVYDSVDEALAV